MQLSWPKRGDAKRATYSKVVRTPRRAYRIYDYKYLNTDVDDILLSEQLQAIIPDGSGEIASRTETDNCNDLPRAKWSVNLTFLAPLNFSRQDSYLLEYCMWPLSQTLYQMLNTDGSYRIDTNRPGSK